MVGWPHLSSPRQWRHPLRRWPPPRRCRPTPMEMILRWSVWDWCGRDCSRCTEPFRSWETWSFSGKIVCEFLLKNRSCFSRLWGNMFKKHDDFHWNEFWILKHKPLKFRTWRANRDNVSVCVLKGPCHKKTSCISKDILRSTIRKGFRTAMSCGTTWCRIEIPPRPFGACLEAARSSWGCPPFASGKTSWSYIPMRRSFWPYGMKMAGGDPWARTEGKVQALPKLVTLYDHFWSMFSVSPKYFEDT